MYSHTILSHNACLLCSAAAAAKDVHAPPMQGIADLIPHWLPSNSLPSFSGSESPCPPHFFIYL